MRRCLDRLERLADDDPRLRRAVDNVAADCRGPGNPHGNIPPQVQGAIGSETDDLKVHDRDGFTALFARWVAVTGAGAAVHYREAPSPPELRRCVSLTTFATFHRGDGSPSAMEAAKALRNLVRATGALPRIPPPLEGTTGALPDAMRPLRPCWWTWHNADIGPPEGGSGLVYMQELAVSEDERNQGQDDRWVVEIRLTPEALRRPPGAAPSAPGAAPVLEQVPLYKPSALDAFGVDTAFQPDLSETPHGWTCPTAPGRRRRPELIGFPVRYAHLPRGGKEVALMLYRWDPGATP